MKSNKGIAMLSLVIYVASFLVITMLVGTISTYFYNNMDMINSTVGGNAEYNKLNLYLVTLIKKKELSDIKVGGYDYDGDGNIEAGTILFYTKDGLVVLSRTDNYLFYNQTLLCSDVTNFTPTLVYKNGKKVLVVNVKIAGSAFATEYVIG